MPKSWRPSPMCFATPAADDRHGALCQCVNCGPQPPSSISNAVAPQDAVDVDAVAASARVPDARLILISRRFGLGGPLRTERFEPRLLLVGQLRVERVERRVHGLDRLQ